MRKLRKALRKASRESAEKKEKSSFPKARKVSWKKLKGNYDLAIY